MKKNWLKLNDNKTEIMVFGTKHALSTHGDITLQIGDAVVESKGHVKNLGVVEDPQLSMNRQKKLQGY